ncbi:hypothetical protein N9D31_00955 [Oligoflexaceae bacterium]|nr:hypothetical protein [Oligoflexaceae bacterium]
MNVPKIKISLTLTEETCQSTRNLVSDFVSRFSKSEKFIERADLAFATVFEMFIQNNKGFEVPSEIGFDVGIEDGKLKFNFINKGMPVYHGDEWSLSKTDQINNSQFKKLVKLVDEHDTQNMGRTGQCLTLSFDIESEKDRAPAFYQPDTSDEEASFEIRQLKDGEEPELSRLFFKVYGYNYINETVYYPSRVKELIALKDLESWVAVDKKGKIIGHVGLLRHHRKPQVFEAALGLTDPNVKSRGLFSKIFEKVINEVGQKEMAFCVYDFVTNLIYSQKLVARYGSCDMALNIGCQVSETQAQLGRLGLGQDPEGMDRYSILLGIHPGVKHPLGERVTLPVSLGALAEFILEPLNITWMPSPRFFPMMREGSFTRNLQPTQKAVSYIFHEPGQKALSAIITDWKNLLRSGYQYASVDMPLDKAGIGQLHDILSASGFFIAGFVPFQFTPRLGFRFQSIGPTKVAFDKIQVFSESAIKLKNLIQEDYERNVLI